MQASPRAAPKEAEVPLDVKAVGFNFRDVYERESHGHGQKPPAFIGVEGAGVVAGTADRVA